MYLSHDPLPTLSESSPRHPRSPTLANVQFHFVLPSRSRSEEATNLIDPLQPRNESQRSASKCDGAFRCKLSTWPAQRWLLSGQRMFLERPLSDSMPLPPKIAQYCSACRNYPLKHLINYPLSGACRVTPIFWMSFFRHLEIYPSDGGISFPANAPAHRLDESPAGYSSAGCSPAEPASASPTAFEYAVRLSCRARRFHRTANWVLTVSVSQPDKRIPMLNASKNSPMRYRS
jgi:hypothetical protein